MEVKAFPGSPQQTCAHVLLTRTQSHGYPSCKGSREKEYLAFVDSIMWEEKREGGGNGSWITSQQCPWGTNNAGDNDSLLPEDFLWAHHLTYISPSGFKVHYNRPVRAISISTLPGSPSFSFAQVQTADKGQQSNASSPGLSQDVLCRLWRRSLTDHLPCDYLCVFVVSADFHKSLWVLNSITTWQMKKLNLSEFIWLAKATCLQVAELRFKTKPASFQSPYPCFCVVPPLFKIPLGK